jgi:cytochrome c biogenesis factor
MVNFIWLGGLIFVIGSIVAVFPDAQERQRLAGLQSPGERAVA